jgi:uncharacterized protein (TIGR03435 family)
MAFQYCLRSLGKGWCLSVRETAAASSPNRSRYRLARNLSSKLKTIVTDETGLTGEIRLHPYLRKPGTVPPARQFARRIGDSLPDIFAALQWQLGLTLDRQRVPVEVYVVDHVNKAN